MLLPLVMCCVVAMSLGSIDYKRSENFDFGSTHNSTRDAFRALSQKDFMKRGGFASSRNSAPGSYLGRHGAQASFVKLCAEKNGHVDPSTGVCYVVFMDQLSWDLAWSACRRKTVHGRRGVLAQPKLLHALQSMLDYINVRLRFVRLAYQVEVANLFIGFKKHNSNYYFPSVGSSGKVIPGRDQLIPKNSSLWNDQEPNSMHACGSVSFVRKPNRFNDMHCRNTVSTYDQALGYVCQF
jgi:hypothetical protein